MAKRSRSTKMGRVAMDAQQAQFLLTLIVTAMGEVLLEEGLEKEKIADISQKVIQRSSRKVRDYSIPTNGNKQHA